MDGAMPPPDLTFDASPHDLVQVGVHGRLQCVQVDAAHIGVVQVLKTISLNTGQGHQQHPLTAR